MPQPSRGKYTEDSDELVIEDETERVTLTGNISVGTSVTGIFSMCLFHTGECCIMQKQELVRSLYKDAVTIKRLHLK